MTLQHLWDLVEAIPQGHCVSYGALGRALPNPTSGRIVGRWMASAPSGLPWWRVIAKSGALPISKRDPALGLTQRQLLEQENIPFQDDLVLLSECEWEPGL